MPNGALPEGMGDDLGSGDEGGSVMIRSLEIEGGCGVVSGGGRYPVHTVHTVSL